MAPISDLLSQRAIRSFTLGEGADYFWEVKKLPQYDAGKRPDGFIDLSGSVNNLMHDWMQEYVDEAIRGMDAHSLLNYGPLHGSKDVQHGAANVYNKFFSLKFSIEATNVFATNGVSSAIDMLVWVLADPGDTILIPVPTFFMLDFDLAVRNGIKVVKVITDHLEDPFGPGSAEEFAEAITMAADGIHDSRVRAVFLCNPQNPQGRCYSKQTLRALAEMCRQRGLQLVVDEIYGLSHFGGELEPFTSILGATDQRSDKHVHSLWGLSKDFGMGGLRLGFIVSRNETLRKALARISWFTWPTSFSDSFASRLLQDESAFENYVRTYQSRLAHAYEKVSEALLQHQISFQPATAGLFIYIDLRRWINQFEGADEPELQLWKYLVDSGVGVNPGKFAGSTEAGFFRLVFTKDVEATLLAIMRIGAALKKLDANARKKRDHPLQRVRSGTSA
ncbi:1-aminocyclopropane-1-carboxylate synthase 9 [Colletotrichum siamense]|uniref:1-aminocyclopropane-1-carboxylate synthase 9 n=1 Tax=Colletotrichum siamense TaxID=690259 RepID=UPI00187269D4|nr:1-aminocyclopropane-1-carboxylate synthase 9 [Colletotrichum siamense]KAF5501748.1 1-aminocyclopropane-1-carboxylate synthase 9 [Colletotrichum siamense]